MEKKFSEQFSSLHELFKAYRKSERCLAAFNVNDNYDLKAVVEAANEMNTHVMVMTYPPVADLITPQVFAKMVEGVRLNAHNKVFLHLDHSTSVDQCKAAIDAGYDSVMIDGSQQPLEENIKMTKEVVEYAKSANVVVEAEIGKILGRGVEVKSDDDFLASVADVTQLYEEANPDIVAVGIGTAHGFTPQEPKIHFGRLGEIADAIPAPLVLHGGTGIPDQDIQKSISMGMSKINIGTIVHTTYMQEALKRMNEAGKNAYPPFIMNEVVPLIKEVVVDRLKAVNFQDELVV
ncbi:class II fructose-bisphosphate aldolase [Flammeovirga sp. OC4]|uniref:class II fructose-bisphosphate aldolase n=1 Tax=Flammeovirga sp. OC4 TaxID=1382345 RepID=UPI0006949F38|nr:class II fructose-bisphosphate aldolase [Flammeovirga sp. OC4]